MKAISDPHLLHDFITASADQSPEATALSYRGNTLAYQALHESCRSFSGALAQIGIEKGERIAIYLEKRFECVTAMFGSTMAGSVFVPINPLLKPQQVAHILRDCGVRLLVTSPPRMQVLRPALVDCHDLRHLVLVGSTSATEPIAGFELHEWGALQTVKRHSPYRVIDQDMAAILYTSGSTGRPKGVVLSHRNMVAGARSVASYLENCPDDTLLAALPLSFDAGLSQLTTAFSVGARVALLDYLFPKDVITAIEREAVTGLTAVPPLWIQLAQHSWPEGAGRRLRYIANTGGRMPRATLDTLRQRVPQARPFLMYGLTEAFRASYLPPEEVDRRPDSIGKAIPNAEVLVLREDGSECAANEPGELVQRGALVAMGYWNDAEKTAERFKPLPAQAPSRQNGLMLPEIAVFSGDTVRRDEEGFLYFIGRRDEMIKTSGYRVSPTEVEEIVYATGLVGECAALGLAHDTLGQAIVLIATAPGGGSLESAALLAECRIRMPAYMVPNHIEIRDGLLPRNPNGKIDRKALATELSS